MAAHLGQGSPRSSEDSGGFTLSQNGYGALLQLLPLLLLLLIKMFEWACLGLGDGFVLGGAVLDLTACNRDIRVGLSWLGWVLVLFWAGQS